MAAGQILHEHHTIVVAGGQESISLVQKQAWDWAMGEADPTVLRAAPDAYLPMLQTAEIVAELYVQTAQRPAVGLDLVHVGNRNTVDNGAWADPTRRQGFEQRDVAV